MHDSKAPFKGRHLLPSLSVGCSKLVRMFEATVRDDEGRVIDPRDVPRPSRLSLFAAFQLDRFASVLSANVEALEEDNQLELGAHLSSCKATLDWLLCRVASSLAVKDAASPLVQHADTSGRGEPIMRQLAGHPQGVGVLGDRASAGAELLRTRSDRLPRRGPRFALSPAVHQGRVRWWPDHLRPRPGDLRSNPPPQHRGRRNA